MTGGTNARELAFSVLLEAQRGAFVTDCLDDALRRSGLEDRERRLATELACGVVRRQHTLDAVLRTRIQRPREKVETELWTLLQLGVYQLLFLDDVPAYAAVSATVDLAARTGRPQWTGFANGVLRGTGRIITDQTSDEPGPAAVPAAGRYRVLSEPVFANPQKDLVAYFTDAFSVPEWLAWRWSDRMPADDLYRLGFWINAPAPLCLRVDLSRTTREAAAAELAAAGAAVRPGAHPAALWLAERTRVEELPGFATGLISVQDESAQGAATLLAPQPGERVLDLCAAPGGKTTHLAELMHRQGSILAIDISHDRVARIRENCARGGIDIVQTHVRSRAADEPLPGPFDAVLIDAPCSNTGVLGKRPDARWRFGPQDLAELTDLQARLLQEGLAAVRPGGRAVYATCSIEPEENGELVRRFLAAHSAWRLTAEQHHVPGLPGDGGYQALLTRD